MDPLKDVEGMVAESGTHPTNRSKKASKRKRQLSKREPDGVDDTPSVVAADNLRGERGQGSKGTNVASGRKSDKSKNKSQVTYLALKKSSHEFLKDPKGVPKQENTKTKKKKKKEKILNVGNIQDLERELEACMLLNGVSTEATSKVGNKKPKPVKVNPKKSSWDPSSNDAGGSWENVSCPDGNDHTPSVVAADNLGEGVGGQGSRGTIITSGNKSNKSKKKSRGTYLASKKSLHEFLKDPKGMPKQENTTKTKKKKKKGKILNVGDVQDLERELEACVLLKGVPTEATSKVGNEKPKPVKVKPKKSSWESSSNDAWGSWENVNCPVSTTDLVGNKPSKKERPLEDGASADISTKPTKASRKAGKKVKNQTAVSNEGGRKTGRNKKEEMFRMKEEAEVLELTKKEKLVRYPEEVFSVGKAAYIVVVLPGQSLYLHGLISVRPLVGKVTILGYRMKELEKQDVHSFNSHALLSVKSVEGCKLSVSQHSHLLEYGLSREQLQDTADKQAGPVVVIELRRAVLPIVRRLSVINQQQVMMSKAKEKEGSKTLGGMLITQKNCSQYHLVHEAAEWRELIECIRLYFECGNAPRVVVCGGKAVGKSTLFKYIVNGLLGENCTKVLCLDIDPGQSELSLPSCLSLTEVTEPLLGPPYTHHFDPSSPNVKHLLIGGVSPQFGLQRYVKVVKELFNLSRDQPDCPLVVNTMGWTVGTGVDLIFDTIRIVEPSHVIQIQGSNFKTNFPMSLEDHVVQGSRGGVRTVPSRSELHYSLTLLDSLSGRKDKVATFTPKLLRELAVMVQFSDLLIDIFENSSDEEGWSTCHTVSVPWPEVVLHVCGAKLPRERILQVLNGNLVALCHVDSSKIESISPDLPKHLINDLDFGQCWGWGVVRGIDPLTQSLYIMTTLTPERFRREVNAVIMPELYLPDKFYGFFARGQFCGAIKKYENGAAKRKHTEWQGAAVKKSKSMTDFQNGHDHECESENDRSDLYNQAVGPGSAADTEGIIPKETDGHQMEQTVEPQLPTEADADHREKGSAAGKATVSQIDIGLIDKNNRIDTESFLKVQDFEVPTDVPKDKDNRSFPTRRFTVTLTNGEKYKRDWLCWSRLKQSLYCAPCFLFTKGDVSSIESVLTSHPGWTIEKGWRALKHCIPSHENSILHKENYIAWKEASKAAVSSASASVDSCAVNQLKVRSKEWKRIYHRILDIILFLSERGLAFCGSYQQIGDSHNGNFLGIVELLSKYDSVLAELVARARNAPWSETRHEVHYLYLSNEVQNEFIEICGSFVQKSIVEEIKAAKYFALAVDRTPDCSHKEQLSFIIRYVKWEDTSFSIEERFLAFCEFSKKTSEEVAEEVLNFLASLDLNFEDCVGQAYDNGSDMAGKYSHIQAILKEKNENCIISSCANNTLNLVSKDCAEACDEAMTFDGIIQKLFRVFSSSLLRWKILIRYLPVWLLKLSKTKCAARIGYVRAIGGHLDGIRNAVAELSEVTNLTGGFKSDLRDIKEYLDTFECVLISAIWNKVLTMTHKVDFVIEFSRITLDVERDKIYQLRADIQKLREKWNDILEEARNVSIKIGVPDSFAIRMGYPTQENAENYFRVNVFFNIIDFVIDGLSRRFSAVRDICGLFDFLWLFKQLDENELLQKANNFQLKYPTHISSDIQSEVLLLKRTFDVNKLVAVSPKEIYGRILNLRFGNVFPNVLVALRIFLSLPATVVSDFRSFDVLKRIESYSQSAMAQERLNGLAILNINSDKAKLLDFSDVIDEFVKRRKKAGKASLNGEK